MTFASTHPAPSPVRRPLAVFLCVVLVFLPVTSCGSSEPPPSSAEKTAEKRAEEGASQPTSSPRPTQAAAAQASWPPPLPSAPQPSVDELRRRLDRSQQMIRQLRSRIDRSQFDLDALVDSLDYEAESIVRFVEQEIAFEAYAGLLRGAKGTLFSRAGNALDQSVLLATLLRDAGHDARIVRGRLSQGDAAALLETMFDPRPPRPAVGDQAAIREILEKAAGLAELDEATARKVIDRAFESAEVHGSAVHRAAERDAATVRRLLDEAGISGSGESFGRELVEEARDYFWVEHRLGPSDPWTPSHPAARKAPTVEERRETLAGEVPASFQHRLRVEVEIEQLLGSRLRRSAVMAPWERPVANMIGVQLSYTNHPDSLQEFVQLKDPAAVAESTSFFAPIFDGNLAEGAQVFDLDGVTLPPSAVGPDSFGASGVVQEVAGQMESAAEGLVGMGLEPGESAPELRALTGQWLVYTLISPEGEERQIRRTLLDRLGAAREREGTVSEADLGDRDAAVWALAGHETFMVAPGEIPDAYAVDQILQKALDLRVLWQARIDALAAEASGSDAEFSVTKELLEAVASEPEVGLLRAFSAADPRADDVVSYRRDPSIVARRTEIQPESGGQARVRSLVDVVNSGEQALRKTSAGVVPAVDETMRIGSWITHAEAALPLGLAAPPSARHLDAADLFEHARSRGVDLEVLGPGQVERTASLQLPWRTRQEMRRALDDGHAVIAPKRLESELEAHWWRIDPATGKTLGMGPDGRGTASTEYMILLETASKGFGIGFGMAGFGLCVAKTSCNVQQCLATAGLGAVMGYYFGAAMGALGVALVEAPLAAGLARVGLGAVADAWAKEVLVSVLFGGEVLFSTFTMVGLPLCFRDGFG